MLLLGRSRYDLAAREVRAELAEDPEDPAAHAILALILSDQGEADEALEEADRAVGLGPETPFCHYARALVLDARKKYPAAAAAAEEAIRLDPEDADYHAALALARIGEDKWSGALEAAERGLGLDPENADCLNCRATALTKLGRGAEADAAARSALERNPEDAELHATRGWTLLETGRHREAAESFREALRLDPESERARRGVIEALKARNPAYRLILRYLFWMGRIGRRGQWFFIIGLVVGVQVLKAVARRVPALAGITWPIIAAYAAFVFVSWLSEPLSNLLLMLNRFGRLALSARQRNASRWLAVCLGVGACGLGAGWWASDLALLMLGLLGLTISIPVSASLRCEEPRPRRILLGYTALLLGLGLASTGMVAAGVPGALKVGSAYLIGWVIFSWVANLIQR